MNALKMFGQVVAAVLGVIVVFYIWKTFPGFITKVMNWNLSLLSWVSSLLPVPYGAMVEDASRLFGADGKLIFLEGNLVVLGVWYLICSAWSAIFGGGKK